MAFNLMGPEFQFLPCLTRRCGAMVESAARLDAAFRAVPDVAGDCVGVQAACEESRKAGEDLSRELTLTSLRPLEQEEIRSLDEALGRFTDAVGGLGARLGLFHLRRSRPAVQEISDSLLAMARGASGMLSGIARKEPPGKVVKEMAETARQASRFILVGLAELYETDPEDRAEMMEVIKWSRVYDQLEDLCRLVSSIHLSLSRLAERFR